MRLSFPYQLMSSHLVCRWLVGVSYRIITYKDPVPTLEKSKRAISQLASVPGAIYLSRGSMTAEAPSTSLPIFFFPVPQGIRPPSACWGSLHCNASCMTCIWAHSLLSDNQGSGLVSRGLSPPGCYDLSE